MSLCLSPNAVPCVRCGAGVSRDLPDYAEVTLHPNGVITCDDGRMRVPFGIEGAYYCPDCSPHVAVCRECGCTDQVACPGGCYWIEPDLCSRCVHQSIETATSAILTQKAA